MAIDAWTASLYLVAVASVLLLRALIIGLPHLDVDLSIEYDISEALRNSRTPSEARHSPLTRIVANELVCSRFVRLFESHVQLFFLARIRDKLHQAQLT